MDQFEDHNPLLLYAVSLVTLYLVYRLLRTDPEVAVPYNVTPPEQVAPGWKGEVLHELSMKVSSCKFFARKSLTLKDLWIPSDPMLCPRNRRVSGPYQPLHDRVDRQRHCESRRGADKMGTDDVRRTEKGSQDYVEICLGKSGDHCACGLP
jgi:hypothetical protein